MAMPPTCPDCRQGMHKEISRKREVKGDTVVYECGNSGCPTYVKSDRKHRTRSKVFEDK